MNKVYPRISIVTVNYNKAKFLERTIRSVLDQEYPNLEYIVIDGGSTDGSVDIIRKYESKLSYWISEPDKGMYYALQKGFSHTTGDILAWINSDDMYHRNAFYTVAEIFCSHSNIDWIVGYNSHWDDNDRCINVIEPRYFNHLSFLMEDFKFVQQESCFWRRTLFEKVGGIDVRYKLAGDFALWMKFSRVTKMTLVYALLGGFRVSKEDQLSDNIEEYIRECQCIIKSEEISNQEKEKIKKYHRNFTLVRIITKVTQGWFNSQRLLNLITKDFLIEKSSQKLFFDRKAYKF